MRKIIVLGGAWLCQADDCRAAYRDYDEPDVEDCCAAYREYGIPDPDACSFIGLRVVTKRKRSK